MNNLQRMGREMREAWAEWNGTPGRFPSERLLNAMSEIMDAADPGGIHLYRVDEIRAQRAYAKSLGGESMPSEVAIDDLLLALDEFEKRT
jgi:hypothetical protein